MLLPSQNPIISCLVKIPNRYQLVLEKRPLDECLLQNHIVEVPASSNKKWMKNKKKSGGKKAKKKGGPVAKGGAPVKKPSVANNVSAVSTSSPVSSSTDVVEQKDSKPAGQQASPADSVVYLLCVHVILPLLGCCVT